MRKLPSFDTPSRVNITQRKDIGVYQHPPTGHQLRPVGAQEPSKGDLWEVLSQPPLEEEKDQSMSNGPGQSSSQTHVDSSFRSGSSRTSSGLV